MSNQEAKPEVKEELEKKKKEAIPERTKVEEKTTVDKKSSGSKYNDNREEKKGKEIKESEGILDTFSSFWEAMSGTGRFEGDESSVFDRIGKAFGKADNITKILSGAGITMALMKLIDNIKEDDNDDPGESFSDEIKKNKKTLDDKIDKYHQESSTLSARITNAMQNQNIANSLAGSGVMMKSLAMISIKTQESLKSISDFLYKTSLAQSECLSNLSDSIEDISDGDGDLLQGMMPLLIGGLMVSFSSFFLGDKNKKGVIDNLIDRVVNSLISTVLGSNANDSKENGILGSFTQKILEIFEVNKNEITKSINNLTGILSSDVFKNLSEYIKNINDNRITEFLDKIVKFDFDEFSNSIKTLSNVLSENSSAIGNIGRAIGKLFPQEQPSNDNKTLTESQSKEDSSVLGRIKSSFNDNKNLFVINSLITSLDRIASSINVFLDEDKRKKIIEDFKKEFVDSFSTGISEIFNVVKKEIEEITKLDFWEEISLLAGKTMLTNEEYTKDIQKLVSRKIKTAALKADREYEAEVASSSSPIVSLTRTPTTISEPENSQKSGINTNVLSSIENAVNEQVEMIANLEQSITELTGVIITSNNTPPTIVNNVDLNQLNPLLEKIENSLGKIDSKIDDLNKDRYTGT